MSCQHEDFQAHVMVGRIGGGEGGSPEWFVAEVRVHCIHCAKPFAFKGLRCGASQTEPMVSADGLEARLPLASPAEIALSEQPGLYGLMQAPLHTDEASYDDPPG
jgi:hypothetical protein